ncbi:DUF6390 family protein [Mycobacterium sp. UM_CSW]|uniref:DUF6390 family protein n=1 Tax=Mycobacterium sp. UM_CSW TaxID=1370119 RepID=UPI000423729F|nr:DUF6390 family protein [Mycobacterium sp. UM_CSW]
MTIADITDTRGAEMFARYAYAPNQLGYCGPRESSALLNGGRAEIERAARRFTGAWPYLRVMSRLTGIPDPLDLRLVESYWLGGGAGSTMDSHAFTAELMAIIAPQAGHYWAHLTEDLAEEAAANHGFHVFGVYPWSRLLGRGVDEHPVSVLDNCRISWGTVLSTDGDTALVVSQQLCFTGSSLSLSGPRTRRVGVRTGEGRPIAVRRGDLVAMHWGWVCDRLIPEQLARLKDSTHRQLAATNRRLRAQAP